MLKIRGRPFEGLILADSLLDSYADFWNVGIFPLYVFWGMCFCVNAVIIFLNELTPASE